MAESANPAASPVPVPATSQDATYWEQMGKLKFQEAKVGTEATRELGTQRANTQYGQGLLSQQEPGTYRANQARANAGGILESGINARNRGNIASNYANKRFSLSKGLKENEGRIERGAQAKREGIAEGEHTAGISALERGRTKLLQEGPTEPNAAETVAKAFPGGIAEQRAYTKANSKYAPAQVPRIASENPQKTTGGVREKAAQGYLGKAKAKARF